MRIQLLRNSLMTAALIGAFAAVPMSQALAQDAASQPTQAADNQTMPDKAADAWITTKVKSELATAKHVKASDISVETSDSVVTLTGTVGSAKTKAHVVKLAKSVKGVRSVDATGLTVSAMSKHQTPMSDMPPSSASSGY